MIHYNSTPSEFSQDQNQKNLRKRIPSKTFINKLIDPYIYGIKRNGKPQAYARIETLETRLQDCNYGYSINNGKYLAHCDGHSTLYYYSRFQIGKSNVPKDEILPEHCMLLYLDIDIQKSQGIGTNEDAAKAIAELQRYFPNLYCEENRRAYLFIYNDGFNRDEFKTIIGSIEEKFNLLLTTKCHIEKFEIKGLPCDIYRDSSGWHVDGYGTLAKLPTQLLTRLDEFYLSEIVTLTSLENLAIEQPVAPQKVDFRTLGSVTNTILDELQLALVPEVIASYKHLSYYCQARRTDDPAGRRKMLAVDFAIGLTILSICKLRPNRDGSLPKKRVMAIWQYLHQHHIIDRAWDNSRWKVIRDTFADCDFLELETSEYWFHQSGEKGKSMKFSLRSEFANPFSNTSLSSLGEQELSYLQYRWRPKLIFVKIELDYAEIIDKLVFLESAPFVNIDMF